MIVRGAHRAVPSPAKMAIRQAGRAGGVVGGDTECRCGSACKCFCGSFSPRDSLMSWSLFSCAILCSTSVSANQASSTSVTHRFCCCFGTKFRRMQLCLLSGVISPVICSVLFLGVVDYLLTLPSISSISGTAISISSSMTSTDAAWARADAAHVATSAWLRRVIPVASIVSRTGVALPIVVVSVAHAALPRLWPAYHIMLHLFCSCFVYSSYVVLGVEELHGVRVSSNSSVLHAAALPVLRL